MTLREFKEKYGSLPQPTSSTNSKPVPALRRLYLNLFYSLFILLFILFKCLFYGIYTVLATTRGMESVFSMMDGTKLDLSGISVGDFDTKARKDILSRLNSAMNQVQNFTVEK